MDYELFYSRIRIFFAPCVGVPWSPIIIDFVSRSRPNYFYQPCVLLPNGRFDANRWCWRSQHVKPFTRESRFVFAPCAGVPLVTYYYWLRESHPTKLLLSALCAATQWAFWCQMFALSWHVQQGSSQLIMSEHPCHIEANSLSTIGPKHHDESRRWTKLMPCVMLKFQFNSLSSPVGIQCKRRGRLFVKGGSIVKYLALAISNPKHGIFIKRQCSPQTIAN